METEISFYTNKKNIIRRKFSDDEKIKLFSKLIFINPTFSFDIIKKIQPVDVAEVCIDKYPFLFSSTEFIKFISINNLYIKLSYSLEDIILYSTDETFPLIKNISTGYFDALKKFSSYEKNPIYRKFLLHQLEITCSTTFTRLSCSDILDQNFSVETIDYLLANLNLGVKNRRKITLIEKLSQKRLSFKN